MNIPFEILLLTSGVGALQSAFFGVYLFSVKKGKNIANLLLAFLLLAFAVRMTKSISYYFSEGHTISGLLMNFGYGTHLATLPLLWLYLNAFIKNDFRFQWERDSIHLLPSILVILLSPFLTSYFWMEQHGYTISLLLMGTYLPFCYYFIYKHFNEMTQPEQVWLLCLTTGVTIVWAVYTANFIFGLVSYITAPVIFSFVMYFMTYLGLKQNNIFTQGKKYANSAFTPEEIQDCFERLKQIMENEQVFKEPALTLPKLAKQLIVSPNMLSETINKMSAQNFPDFINSYRIKEAQALLAKPESGNKKIASIAFETGFNTLSAFNAAFKKFTSLTPSEYRKKASKC